MLLTMRGAIVHHAPQGVSVIIGVFGGIPYRGNAKLSAAALLVVVRAINAPPSVVATNLYTPLLIAGVLQNFLDLFLLM